MVSARTDRWWWSLYAYLHDWPWRGPLAESLVEQIQRRAGACSGNVLDAGTGTGPIASRMTTTLGRVVGMDISAPMLARAAGRPGVWICGDVRHPPFAQRAFEVVIAAKLPYLCDAPEAAVRALVTLVRPGGRLVLCWPYEKTGPWRVYRAERRLGATPVPALARLVVRVLVGLSAPFVRGPARVPASRIAAAVRQVAGSGRIRQSHEIALGGLFHLVVLTPHPWNTLDRNGGHDRSPQTGS